MFYMKILIAYATKTGTTEKCAKILAERLGGADLFNLSNGKPDLSNYDIVIIGGSIRAGMLHKAAKKFVQQSSAQLLEKKVAFFVSSADVGRANEFLKANIPAELLEKSICGDSFGGEMTPESFKGLFGFVIKKMVESNQKKGVQLPVIVPENIERFAAKVKAQA
jgi:menaquinone-dependent protoporphyrinogen oxidase